MVSITELAADIAAEIFKPRHRPEWLVAIDREGHESVCTKSIMERERSILTAHIRIALSGKSQHLAQFMANREAVRG